MEELEEVRLEHWLFKSVRILTKRERFEEVRRGSKDGLPFWFNASKPPRSSISWLLFRLASGMLSSCEASQLLSDEPSAFEAEFVVSLQFVICSLSSFSWFAFSLIGSKRPRDEAKIGTCGLFNCCRRLADGRERLDERLD